MTVDRRTQVLSRPYVEEDDAASASKLTDTPQRATTHTYAGVKDAAPAPEKLVTPYDVPEDSEVETVANATNNALMAMLKADDFVPNILSDYRQPMYHFRMFMTTEHEIVTGQGTDTLDSLYKTLEGLPKVTIAESGVTAGFNIQSVEFEQTAGPGFRNRSSTMSNITINIVEPLGSSLSEAILNASTQLGVQNFAKMWHYLELTFLAYNDDGSVNLSPLDGMNLPNGGKWIYQISINRMEVHMDSAGANYKLTCVPYPMTAFSDDGAGRVPDVMKVSGKTIKEFCDDFAQELTQKWTDRYQGEIYKIKVNVQPFTGIGDVGGFHIIQSEFDPVRNMALDKTGGGAPPQATIPRGTTIADVITFLFCNCEETQKMILDTNTSQDAKDSGSGETVTFNGKDYRVPIVPYVEADVRVTGYDPITGTYMKEITYNIWGYRSYSSNITTDQLSNIKKDPRVATAIVAELKKKNYLKKKYEWQFTGMNTELIRFDLDFNFAFSAVLPKLNGWRQGVKQVSQHDKFNTALKNGADMKDQNAETKPDILPIDQIQSRLQAANNTITDQQEIIDDDSKTPAEKAAAAAARDAAIKDRARLGRDIQVRRAASLQKQRETRELIESRGAVNIYAEDVTGTEIPFDLSYVQGQDEGANAAGIGFSGQWHRGASLAGSLLNQLYEPNLSANGGAAMASVTLEIRGDPYWLSYSHIERRVIQSSSSIPDYNSPLPNFTDGDSTLALIFKFPSRMGDSGEPIIRDDDVFNGLYRVTNVRSSFNAGEFKQTLEAVKLDLITPLLSQPGASSGAPANPGNN